MIGFGTAPRGEVAMTVPLIGLNARVIGQEIFVPTVITPIVLQNRLLRPGTPDECPHSTGIA